MLGRARRHWEIRYFSMEEPTGRVARAGRRGIALGERRESGAAAPAGAAAICVRKLMRAHTGRRHLELAVRA